MHDLPALGTRLHANLHMGFADELVIGELEMMLDFKEHDRIQNGSYTVK